VCPHAKLIFATIGFHALRAQSHRKFRLFVISSWSYWSGLESLPPQGISCAGQRFLPSTRVLSSGFLFCRCLLLFIRFWKKKTCRSSRRFAWTRFPPRNFSGGGLGLPIGRAQGNHHRCSRVLLLPPKCAQPFYFCRFHSLGSVFRSWRSWNCHHRPRYSFSLSAHRREKVPVRGYHHRVLLLAFFPA
jgi:hypothetical protein